MNSILPISYECDDAGRLRVIHCRINGREKALSPKEYLKAHQLMLPQGPPADQPANTLPRDYEPANGR